MNALLAAAAIMMGSETGWHPDGEGQEAKVRTKSWSSEFDYYRSLGRAEAHLTESASASHTGAAGVSGASYQGPDIYALRELGRAESKRIGVEGGEATVEDAEISYGGKESGRLCPHANDNPRKC